MSLRLACDLDGTLADLEHALQCEAERIFGERVSVRPSRTLRRVTDARRRHVDARSETAPTATTRSLDAREQSHLWNHLRETGNFWETLPEIEPGAVSRLAAAAAAQGWEVIFITSRPDTAGDTVQVQSQRWLRTHGFELPSVFVVSESRGHVAASLSLDVVIDDSPENCVDVAADSGATPLLLWRAGADLLPPGLKRLPIHVVSSMADAITYLGQLSAQASAPRRRLAHPR